jgi:hypothetical protein
MLTHRIRIAANWREDLASVGELDLHCRRGAGNKFCRTMVSTGAAGPPTHSPSETRTAASSACSRCRTPHSTRQWKIMLVAMLWRRQTAAALTPGCSASITIASFSASVNLRRFDPPSCAGPAVAPSVKSFLTGCSLAALLVVVRTLRWRRARQSICSGSASSRARQVRML